MLKLKFSLRNKLLLIYSLFILTTFVGFSFWIYKSIEKWIYRTVDESIYSTAISIDKFLENSYYHNIETTINDNQNLKALDILKNVYEAISLNPRRHYIQIFDNENSLIWKSANLQKIELPKLPTQQEIKALKTFAQEIYDYDTIPATIYRKNLTGLPGDSIFVTVPFENTHLRIFLLRTQNANITVGYSLTWIERFLEKLANMFYIALPIIISVLIVLLLVISYIVHSQTQKLSLALNKFAESDLRNFDLSEFKNKYEFKFIVDSLEKLHKAYQQNHDKILSFAYDASHELKTPLTILRGELEMSLNSAKTVEDYQQVVASALDEVIRLSNVVSTVLELAKVENSNSIFNFTEVNFSDLVRDICEDMEIIAEEKNIELIMSISNDIIINGEKTKIHQMVLNLIDNAIKYTPNGGQIKISLHKDNYYAKLIVEDTGIGISEEQIPDIFTKFYRTQEAKKFGVQGTGLGLSLVKAVVDIHKGEIKVESKLNKGTKFTVSLPLGNVNE